VYAAYTWQNVVVVVWFGPVTLASLASYAEDHKLCAERHPSGTSRVNIMVPGGRSMPASEARDAFGRITRQYAANIAGVAVVIPGTGFWRARCAAWSRRCRYWAARP
jgi:hypothetical protein